MNLTIRRILTLFQYIPFFAAVCYKFLKDIKKFLALGMRGISTLTTLYYGFLLYYTAICAYRFLTQREVKENLYYTIVLVGSLALFILLQEKELELFIKDYVYLAFWIIGLLALYRVVYLVFFTELFERAPINVNLTTGIIAMLLPVLFRITCDKALPAPYRGISSVLIAITLVIVALTGSRSIFWLSCVVVIIETLFSAIKWKQNFLSTLIPITSAIACICIFYQFDIGDMRYSIYREMDISIVNEAERVPESSFSTPAASSPLATGDETTNHRPTTSQPASQLPPASSSPGQQASNVPTDSNIGGDSASVDEETAKQQVISSDRVRIQLVEWGLQQIKENWIIGSGDVLYWYQIDETHLYEQSSHNFVINDYLLRGCWTAYIISDRF